GASGGPGLSRINKFQEVVGAGRNPASTDELAYHFPTANRRLARGRNPAPHMDGVFLLHNVGCVDAGPRRRSVVTRSDDVHSVIVVDTLIDVDTLQSGGWRRRISEQYAGALRSFVAISAPEIASCRAARRRQGHHRSDQRTA